MHDFTAEFLKCVKFHGKFTERISEIHGPHRLESNSTSNGVQIASVLLVQCG